MALLVKKFGGTSVGSLDRIRSVAEHLIEQHQPQQKILVVVSAMSGETDRLINLAHTLCQTPSPRELAALITTGEQVTMTLLAMLLSSRGIASKSFNAGQLNIQTDEAYTTARIHSIDVQKIHDALAKHDIIIVAGFQGCTSQGDVTALGRGGSDTSAVALAAALKAEECQIYTDVEGIYTADPRLVPNAYRLDTIDFQAMLELANLGAKVLQLRSVELAGKYQIPLRVLSSFKKGPGTLINYFNDKALEAPTLSGLSHQLQLHRLTIKTPLQDPHALARIIRQLAQANIIIDHITQHHDEQHCIIKFILNREEYTRALALLTPLCESQQWQLKDQSGLARLALVGIGLQSYSWIQAKFFTTLAEEQISPFEVIHSDLALTVIISETEVTQAAKALHQVFFEGE